MGESEIKTNRTRDSMNGCFLHDDYYNYSLRGKEEYINEVRKSQRNNTSAINKIFFKTMKYYD